MITRRQALATLSLERLRNLVNSGRWQRLRRGVFVAHTGSLTHGQRLWAAVLACGDGALLAGLTAACAGGLRRASGPRIHILVPAADRPMSIDSLPISPSDLGVVPLERSETIPSAWYTAPAVLAFEREPVRHPEVKQLVRQRAVELRPQDPVINDHLGDAYWRVGRRQEARFQWRRALSRGPADQLIPTNEPQADARPPPPARD